MPGPAPKPTALKVFEGNPGEKGLNKFEPRPRQELVPVPPENLSGEAKKIWENLAHELVPLQLLTVIDKNAFARYCEVFVQFFKAKEFIEQKGTTYQINEHVPMLDSNGLPVKDEATGQVIKVKQLKKLATFPQFNQMIRLSAELRRLEHEFGLTPSARSRISIEDGVIKRNPGSHPAAKYAYSIPKRAAA